MRQRKEISVFSQEWFEYYQPWLLRFANTSLGRYFFRLHGTRSSVGKHKLTKLAPHFITWQQGERTIYEFRTHEKFAKRLYYGLKPLWHVLHWWDMQIANNLAPTLNAGFDTLTVFPDADPESTTVDGDVARGGVNESFATIRAGAGTAVSDTTASFLVLLEASGTTDQFATLERSIYLFDTAAIDDAFVINSATLSLAGLGKNTALGADSLHICSSTPASNTSLASSDFTTLGATSFGNITSASYTTAGAYNDISLNASGIAAITKTGISKFGARLGWDINNNFTGSWSSGLDTSFAGSMADEAGTGSDPKLVVVSSATTTSTSSSTSTTVSTSTSTTVSTSTSSTSTSLSTSTSTSISTSSTSTSISSTSSSTSTSFSTSTSLSTSTSTSVSTSSSTSISTTTSSSTSSTSTSISTTTTALDYQTIPVITIQSAMPHLR